jgi:hypothetical protein
MHWYDNNCKEVGRVVRCWGVGFEIDRHNFFAVPKQFRRLAKKRRNIAQK